MVRWMSALSRYGNKMMRVRGLIDGLREHVGYKQRCGGEWSAQDVHIQPVGTANLLAFCNSMDQSWSALLLKTKLHEKRHFAKTCHPSVLRRALKGRTRAVVASCHCQGTAHW